MYTNTAQAFFYATFRGSKKSLHRCAACSSDGMPLTTVQPIRSHRLIHFSPLFSRHSLLPLRRLTYWVVFAAFSILEAFLSMLLRWIPFYFALKLAFLAWCFLPQTQVRLEVGCL